MPPAAGAARADGREVAEQEMPSCKLGVTQKAQGSCYVETPQGAKVICSVFGPKEVALGGDFDQSCCVRVNYSVASFAEDVRLTKRMQRDLGADDSHTAENLKEVFEASIILSSYPKAQIDINILLVERAIVPSFNYTAAVMAGTMALVHAGVEVVDIAMASTACYTSAGTLLLCPTAQEIRNSTARITTTCLPRVGSVLSVTQMGCTTQEQTKAAVELNCQACVALRDAATAVIKEDLKNGAA